MTSTLTVPPASPQTNAPAFQAAVSALTASPTSAPVTKVATLAPSDLKEFEELKPSVKSLISDALALTAQNLSYKYGSSDPVNGGMDCSGTVYFLLRKESLKDVPRDASEMYSWVWKTTGIHAVVSSSPDTFELDLLKPGDLLFWTGTYKVDRDPPITHVMIYLGINRTSGHRVMVGASEGRTFEGKSRYGVSVFDFILPTHRSSPAGTAASTGPEGRFVGYGSIPNLGSGISPISQPQPN